MRNLFECPLDKTLQEVHTLSDGKTISCLFAMRGIKNIRLQYYNYHSDGWYFVTIVTKHRLRHFVGKEKDVKSVFDKTVASIPGVQIDTLVVMPNHVHCILVLHNSALALGETVRRIKATTSHQFGFPVWQPNYFEHVIRNEKSLGRIRAYILLHPEYRKMQHRGTGPSFLDG